MALLIFDVTRKNISATFKSEAVDKSATNLSVSIENEDRCPQIEGTEVFDCWLTNSRVNIMRCNLRVQETANEDASSRIREVVVSGLPLVWRSI